MGAAWWESWNKGMSVSHLSSLTGSGDVEPNLGLRLFRWPQSWGYSATHDNTRDNEEGRDNLVGPKILDVHKIL